MNPTFPLIANSSHAAEISKTSCLITTNKNIIVVNILHFLRHAQEEILIGPRGKHGVLSLGSDVRHKLMFVRLI